MLTEVAKAIGLGAAWGIEGWVGEGGGVGRIGGTEGGVRGWGDEAKVSGGGMRDEDEGYEDEEGEAEGVEEDEGGVFEGEVIFWNEVEIVGVKNSENEGIDDEIALGRGIGQVGTEGEGFGGEEDGQGQEEYASCEVEQ